MITLQALPDHGTLEHIKGGAHHGNAVAPKVGHGAEPARIDWQAASGLIQSTFVVRLARLVRQDRPALPRSTSFLLMLNLILVTAIVVELAVETKFSASVSAAPGVNVDVWPKQELIEFHPPSDDLLDVISKRPLFEPSRRPYVPQITQSSLELELEDVTIELIGTFLSDARRTALIRLETQDDAVWVAEGGYISDWQVESILADRLHLRRMDERRVIDLWPEPGSRPH